MLCIELIALYGMTLAVCTLQCSLGGKHRQRVLHALGVHSSGESAPDFDGAGSLIGAGLTRDTCAHQHLHCLEASGISAAVAEAPSRSPIWLLFGSLGSMSGRHQLASAPWLRHSQSQSQAQALQTPTLSHSLALQGGLPSATNRVNP